MTSLGDSFIYQVHHVHESRQSALGATCIILTVLSTIAVMLRLLARRIIKQPLRADDYLILVAEVSTRWVGLFAC